MKHLQSEKTRCQRTISVIKLKQSFCWLAAIEKKIETKSFQKKKQEAAWCRRKKAFARAPLQARISEDRKRKKTAAALESLHKTHALIARYEMQPRCYISIGYSIPMHLPPYTTERTLNLNFNYRVKIRFFPARSTLLLYACNIRRIYCRFFVSSIPPSLAPPQVIPRVAEALPSEARDNPFVITQKSPQSLVI